MGQGWAARAAGGAHRGRRGSQGAGLPPSGPLPGRSSRRHSPSSGRICSSQVNWLRPGGDGGWAGPQGSCESLTRPPCDREGKPGARAQCRSHSDVTVMSHYNRPSQKLPTRHKYTGGFTPKGR